MEMIFLRKIMLSIFAIFIANMVFATQVWEPLKIVPEIAYLINPIIIWLLLIISSVVFTISLVALKRKKSQKMLFISLAFFFFFTNSFLNVVDFYFSPGYFMNFAVQGLFDFLVILSLLIAIFRK